MPHLTDEQRKQMVLSQEGILLQQAGNIGTPLAIEVGRATVDGAINALLRMQGPVDTTEFLFAAADRAAGGIKDPTPCAIRPPYQPPELGTGRAWAPAPGYASGIAHGFLIAVAITVLAALLH
jgi:hypothetical protein